MTSLKNVPGFMAFALSRAIAHPRTPIRYYFCPDCRVNIPLGQTECPSCGLKVGNSPEPRQISPIPWWGAMLVMVVGVATWVVGSCFNVSGLDEAGRALVYIPLGSLFGMSMPR
ncbi:MAG: hypothetical protein PHQ43_04595 [Dehalococcoidales bacterium]|nr:hypothetical protein [Dehalococcoidales bacterium]